MTTPRHNDMDCSNHYNRVLCSAAYCSYSEESHIVASNIVRHCNNCLTLESVSMDRVFDNKQEW